MKDNDLEKMFDTVCADIPLKEPRDLWPEVSLGIKVRREQSRPSRTFWAAGFSAAAVLIVLSIPGASENIKNGIRKLFSSAYSVQLGEGAPVRGTLISADGEVKEIRSGDMLLEVRVTNMDEQRVIIALSVFYTGKQPDGSVRKLIAKPKILAMKGKSAEVSVTDIHGKQVYKLKMTPVEKSPAAYTGTLSPVIPGH
ncbi:MAG: hypothetical protein A2X31_03885 [Elusimicrobia bacterium GWB2_63_22]|nr:MAG: hypothetical protein A2X31_03885 [Elusimicrobia bacterium GWB2_63_22]